MTSPRIIHALFPEQLLQPDGHFRSDMGLLVEDDRIAMVGTRSDLEEEVSRRRDAGSYVTSRTLNGKALLPGLVNTHSHAFQRGIRGCTEFPDKGRDTEEREDFWSWRGVMYQAADRLTPEDVESLALAVYVEMVKAGITHVGEFHYLHHQPDGTPYDDPDELAWRTLRASRGAGIRLTMLRTYYQRAGVGRPAPVGAQRRFCDKDLDHYLASLERIADLGIPVGIVPHSVRAVGKEDLQRLVEFQAAKGWPMHLHIAEQTKEIEECLQEYGCRPVELLQTLGGLNETTTLVHAIHLSPEEIQAIGTSRCHIASCPTTERNLGDGIVAADQLLKAGARFTFGTDSQCQISPFEDARQLEYHLRLAQQARSILFGDRDEAGCSLLKMLTVNGWSSLGQSGGTLEAGQPSDLIAIDLNHLSLAGSSSESLLTDILFSAPPGVVSDVWIKGVEVLCEGYHRAEIQATQDLRRVMNKLRQA